ncbi:MAG: aminomethyl-transferring glycine dehydrogenase [Verrucomicrobiota bacterium]
MSNVRTRNTLYRDADSFADRHIGPRDEDLPSMLETIGQTSLDGLVDAAIPADIRLTHELDLPPALSEAEATKQLQAIAEENQVCRSYIGQGYHACNTPKVILRNVLENPQWYTPYTPYQAEIAQGRLEVLLHFQTMITDLTGMALANASLLDESTAAAEGMTLAHRMLKRKDPRNVFFVDEQVHPQTIQVIKTRAKPLDLKVVIGDFQETGFGEQVFGALVQYPDTQGSVHDYQGFCDQAHAQNVTVIVAADILSLLVLPAPGSFGADIVVGNTQRFGMPMGLGGPHAGYIAVTREFQRQVPGRIVGISVDAHGHPAFRLALQTREQHIRRDKATSNICTAQALPAMVAAFYAIYHGPKRLRQIALNAHLLTSLVADQAEAAGYQLVSRQVFDTLSLSGGPRRQDEIRSAADAIGINFRYYPDGSTGIALDESVTLQDLADLLWTLDIKLEGEDLSARLEQTEPRMPTESHRPTNYLGQPVFNRFHSETEMMRFLDLLQQRDIGLTDSMIPLGSCTMKLNAVAEMSPVTWPGFASLHPFAPLDQVRGYDRLLGQLDDWLSEITGFHRVSLQPNAGSQGEFAGLMAIRSYHESRGEGQRRICLIPKSAHGTNPASAVMAGLQVVPVECDSDGNIDLADLEKQAADHKESLAGLMITYPSTHGVFEATIRRICDIIHECGGQVYLDGANMNAMVGLCRPGDFGADVCHLNLHKTFCIPHGGGGPGMGPIGVVEHLTPFLPGHPHTDTSPTAVGPVSETPYGSGAILPISYIYIAMMGTAGLKKATQLAILNANYIAQRLDPHFPVLYKGASGLVAHECIIDCRPLKAAVNIDVEDIAKRLMDYGFHAPTMSWPVPGTLMIEPTESESKEELDRFCDAMIAIREEIREIETGEADSDNNVLKNAPHTQAIVVSDDWAYPYGREKAAFPAPWSHARKFWPTVSRIDNVAGDRNLICTCDSVETYA